MSIREVSLEDLNALNNQLSTRINDLSLKVSETSTQLKYINDSCFQTIHEHSEQIGKLFTKYAELKKDIEFLKSSYETQNEELTSKVKEISELSEKYKEIRGEINQIRLFVEKNDNERKEKRNALVRNLIYPILASLILAYCSYRFNQIVNAMVSAGASQPQNIEHVNK